MIQVGSGFAQDLRLLALRFGVIAGPLFCITVLLQAAWRPGFMFMQMPLSVLALGDLGWIQTLNFLVTGALIIAFGWGLSASPKNGKALSALILLYGAGMLSAGLFQSDPINGFPPGAHQGRAISQHAMLHGLSFGLAQLALCAACLVEGKKSLRRPSKWTLACFLAAVLPLAIVAYGFANPAKTGLAFFATGFISLAWLAALSWINLQDGRNIG